MAQSKEEFREDMEAEAGVLVGKQGDNRGSCCLSSFSFWAGPQDWWLVEGIPVQPWLGPWVLFTIYHVTDLIHKAQGPQHPHL